MVMKRALVLVATAAVGCGSLESPSIVVDLRVLGISVEPPEIVAPFVPDNPESVVFDDVEICALVADPGASRQLAFTMVACAPTDTLRCDQSDQPMVDIGAAVVGDPEEAAATVELCATLSNSDELYAVIEESIRVDTLAGFGGIGVQVALHVRPEPGGLDEDLFAAKQMLYSPQFPLDRVANRNPWLDEITATGADGDEIVLPLGRCTDITPLLVDAGAELELLPVEPEGVREDYVVPTFDGAVRELTENLRYAWYATHGDWSANNTGGPRDFAGNDPPLDSTWTAPAADEIGADGLDVSLWLVQRDERGGLAWYQSCVHVDAIAE